MEALQLKSNRQNKKISIGKVVTYAVLILYTLVLFAPFMIIIGISLTSDAELALGIFRLFPEKFSLEGYKIIFTMDPNEVEGVSSILIGFGNTMWQTLIPLFFSLFFSALAAFAYSKFHFPGRKVLFLITVLTMMLPMGAFGFVGYLFYVNIGWVGSKGILALMIPGMFGSAGTIFFLRTYFDSALSQEVFDAAKIDGAGNLHTFFQIALPLSKPAIIAQFLFGFVGGYNSFGGALLYLYKDKSLWNLQLAVSELVSAVSEEGAGYLNAQCASALVAMLPLIVFYTFIQKYFIEGINIGGGKE